MRSVPLWVGSNDDAKVPDRVRLRVFERENGTCWLSGRKIRPGEAWELEHKIALCNGGTHSEDNLAPALVGPHREKTADDRRIKARNDKIRRRHIGIRGKSKFQTNKDGPFKKRLDGTVVRR